MSNFTINENEREFINNIRRFIKHFPIDPFSLRGRAISGWNIAAAVDVYFDSWFIYKYANNYSRHLVLSPYMKDGTNVEIITKDDAKRKNIDVQKCMSFLNISVPIKDGRLDQNVRLDPAWSDIVIEFGKYPPIKAFEMITTKMSSITFNESEQNFIDSLKNLVDYTKSIKWHPEAKDTEHLELVFNSEYHEDAERNGWHPYLRNAYFVYPVIDNGPFISFDEARKCEIDVHKCLDYLGITRCNIDNGDYNELLL